MTWLKLLLQGVLVVGQEGLQQACTALQVVGLLLLVFLKNFTLQNLVEVIFRILTVAYVCSDVRIT
jgi:hypothetical protein